ncbi:hypothetical protein RCL_jg15868.t1 [Rhizophagus clarus]|uniref:Uncharacterized protein n=1 Tax=Rhizophagus clarus TaxID=94130 RepID=A0A8H3QKM1_9GLOM|nr:hypothetical protein RCL_jg15868.t1 [Rhizophagus clarus]
MLKVPDEHNLDSEVEEKADNDENENLNSKKSSAWNYFKLQISEFERNGVNEFDTIRENIDAFMAQIPGKIVLTADMWTSDLTLHLTWNEIKRVNQFESKSKGGRVPGWYTLFLVDQLTVNPITLENTGGMRMGRNLVPNNQ